MSLYNELKRRNVLRMAMLYAVASWLIMQVAEVVIGLAQLTDWIGPAILWLLALGFPIALLFSWFYEITPEGVSLERDIDPAQSITHLTSRRLDFIVISMLCAAVILFAYDKWWSGVPPEKSIAVLPFVNMSDDPGQEYFSDGLSDTLIHVLAQVSGLKVAAKTSSFYFKGKNIDIGTIARELNVSTILEGSVQKSGDRVRVIAQLINAADNTHLWSKSFDRDLVDIFAVQDEIAQEVVKALKVTLLDTEEERLAQRYRPTLEAYEQLILGRQEMAKRTAEGLDAAKQHFKQAVELDPDYALAYVGLADTYALLWEYTGLSMEESLEHRQPLIEKALDLNPLSGEAYTARGPLRMARQELKAAEEDFLKAIELNPSYATAYHWYYLLLRNQGRFEDALAQIRVAAELDPMAPIIQLIVAQATLFMGRVEESLTLFRRNIERNPEFAGNYGGMYLLQTGLGHVGDAQRWVKEARKYNPESPAYWNWECLGFLNLGDALSAQDCVKQFSEAHPKNPLTAIARADLHIHQEEWEAAVSTLESISEQTGLDFPGWSAELADLVAGQGDIERARRLMADVFPEWLQSELELTAVDLVPALSFAAILHANGETQRRDVLLLAMEERIATMHRTRGVGYGILDVYIHMMRGDRDRAIAGLREAIDVGWRSNWWTLRLDWKLESLHQDPEFIALLNELEADIRVQRLWYEENKDKPLF